MDKSAFDYRVYIVRFWQEETTTRGQSTARFVLDVPSTGQRYGFVDREELLNALRAELFATHHHSAATHNVDAEQ